MRTKNTVNIFTPCGSIPSAFKEVNYISHDGLFSTSYLFAALTILETTGVTYEEELSETVDMLAQAGAAVDRTAARVRLPRTLITEQVATAPSQVILYGRDPRHDLDLGGHRVHMGSGGTGLTVLL